MVCWVPPMHPMKVPGRCSAISWAALQTASGATPVTRTRFMGVF